MTLEEKIAHLKSASMEEARAEGNAIIDNYKEALEKVLEDHKEEALRQSETRIKAETQNARQQLNKAMSRSQVELKRTYGKVMLSLKDKVFGEVMELMNDFMKTEAYDDYLIKCIRRAVIFAAGDSMVIYVNPSDEERINDLEDACAARLTVSAQDFTGGIRAVIKSRNILIDNSFSTALGNEYGKFVFTGGDGVA